jgi:Subtilisin inhibitor-like
VFPIDWRIRSLVLTWKHGSTPFPADRTVTLRCTPAGGTHPMAHSACRTLILVGGEPTRLNLSPSTFCRRIFDPVTITAIGSWDGRRIRAQRTFSNSCTLRAATGPVYDF